MASTKSTKSTKNTKPAEKVVDRTMADLPAGDRKVALVKALRVAKATARAKGVTLATLVEKLGYTSFDVYGLVNGTSGKAGSSPTCLTATGHVGAETPEEGRGLVVWLTPKGAKTKFDEPPFVRAPRSASNGKA